MLKVPRHAFGLLERSTQLSAHNSFQHVAGKALELVVGGRASSDATGSDATGIICCNFVFYLSGNALGHNSACFELA